MNSCIKLLAAVLCISLTACVFAGCGLFGEKPPSKDKVKETFIENEEAFRGTAKYLLSFEDKFASLESVYLDKPDEATVYTRRQGTVYLDKQTVKPEGDELKQLSALFGAGCKSIGMSGSANDSTGYPDTIYFRMWSAVNRDTDCGITTAKDSSSAPQTEFMTELSPISDDGWYYYVSDYEEWREAR